MAKSKRNLSKKRKTRKTRKTRKNLKGGGFTYVGPRDKNWVDMNQISDEDIGKHFLKGTRIQISSQPLKFEIDKTSIKYLGQLAEIISNYYFGFFLSKKQNLLPIPIFGVNCQIFFQLKVLNFLIHYNVN